MYLWWGVTLLTVTVSWRCLFLYGSASGAVRQKSLSLWLDSHLDSVTAVMRMLRRVCSLMIPRPSTFLTRWVLNWPSFPTHTVVFSPGFCHLASCWLLIGCRPSPTSFQTFSNIFVTSTLSTPKCWFWLAAISEASILVSIWVLYFTHHTTYIPIICDAAYQNQAYGSDKKNWDFKLSVYCRVCWLFWFLNHQSSSKIGEDISIWNFRRQQLYTNLITGKLNVNITKRSQCKSFCLHALFP